jgi:hypothetical protein
VDEDVVEVEVEAEAVLNNLRKAKSTSQMFHYE